MRTKLTSSVSVMIFCLAINMTFAQTINYDIKLSKPDKPGSLDIDVYSSGIKVTGYDQEVVQLTILDNRNDKDKKIGSAELYYQILENNNRITIVNRSHLNRKIIGLNLELMVPRNFSVKLSTYFGPKIEIAGIHGEVDVTGYYTDLNLLDLEENVIATTNQGSLFASFKNINESNIYFLSSYKGNIELILPKDTKATLLMDSYYGKFESEFKLDLDTKPSNQESNRFTSRLINGGGAKLKLVNYFGNIMIKSKI